MYTILTIISSMSAVLLSIARVPETLGTGRIPPIIVHIPGLDPASFMEAADQALKIVDEMIPG